MLPTPRFMAEADQKPPWQPRTISTRVEHSSRWFSCIRALFALLVLAWTPSAIAADDPAAAELLFQRGREGMEAGDWKQACESFAESHRLDPAPGTVMNLATCQEKRGELARAWEHWQQAMRLLDPDDQRREYVSTRIQELEAELPRLTIVVADDAPSGMVVRRDGVELGQASFGIPSPVDPGAHEVVVSSPNHAARTFRLEIEKGEERRIVVAPGSELPDPDEPERGSSQRSWAYVAGGFGVAGVATGIATGIMVNDRQATVNQNCDGRLCNQIGLDAASQGDALLAANTAAWIIGGVGLAAGAVLYFTSPSSEKADPAEPTSSASLRFLPGGAAFSYGGTF